MIGYLLSNLYTAFHELKNNFGYEFTHFVNKLTNIANGLTIFGNDLNLFRTVNKLCCWQKILCTMPHIRSVLLEVTQ
jgi:hypothetical protein